MPEQQTKHDWTEPIGDRYLADRVLAKGAFGAVIKGHHVRTGEQVAIKLDTNAINTITHETKILNYLFANKSKKTPSIYWFGVWQNTPCLVMTLYECSLLDYMKHKVLDSHKLALLYQRILAAIQCIHDRFVVHRDIKPQNFMIKRGEIFLIDFGLATFYVDENGELLQDQPHTTLMGTVKFVSLRVLEGHRYARRDDLFSIGYMYLYMLYGNALWEPAFNEHTGASLEIMHPLNRERACNKSFENIVKIYGLEHGSHIYRFLHTVYALEYAETTGYTFP